MSAPRGGEAVAALFFPAVTLLPGEKRRYQIVLAIDDNPAPYLTPDAVEAASAKNKQWWQEQTAAVFHTGIPQFDTWMRWVSIQPCLRRIFGCSFLPHHDYGRGGRDKAHAIMEFSPAHTAYQNTARTGFRTFCRTDGAYRELFTGKCDMHTCLRSAVIAGMNPALWSVPGPSATA